LPIVEFHRAKLWHSVTLPRFSLNSLRHHFQFETQGESGRHCDLGRPDRVVHPCSRRDFQPRSPRGSRPWRETGRQPDLRLADCWISSRQSV